MSTNLLPSPIRRSSSVGVGADITTWNWSLGSWVLSAARPETEMVVEPSPGAIGSSAMHSGAAGLVRPKSSRSAAILPASAARLTAHEKESGISVVVAVPPLPTLVSRLTPMDGVSPSPALGFSASDRTAMSGSPDIVYSMVFSSSTMTTACISSPPSWNSRSSRLKPSLRSPSYTSSSRTSKTALPSLNLMNPDWEAVNARRA